MNRAFWLLLSFLSTLPQLGVSWSDPSINMELLNEAMQAERKNINYYSLNINGVYFDGARDWDRRWVLIDRALDFSGKRVLDLGCSVGMCSIFLIKYARASSVTAAELELDECRICKQLQCAFDVSFPIYNLNFDQDDYESILGYNHDVVMCLNLYNWVTDKRRLMNYLSHFPVVVYEGHDPDEVEIARFRSIGFEDFQICGRQVHGRTIIVFFNKLEQ